MLAIVSSSDMLHLRVDGPCIIVAEDSFTGDGLIVAWWGRVVLFDWRPDRTHGVLALIDGGPFEYDLETHRVRRNVGPSVPPGVPHRVLPDNETTRMFLALLCRDRERLILLQSSKDLQVVAVQATNVEHFVDGAVPDSAPSLRHGPFNGSNDPSHDNST